MSKQVEKVAEQYLLALKASEEAEAVLAEAKALLTEVCAKSGVTDVVVGDKQVKVIQSVRRNFDVLKLKELVTANLFRKVTKATVDTKAFDSAREQGLISAKQEQAVVEATHYTQVRVGLALAGQASVSKRKSA
jgi:hypothetical protein